MTSKTLIAFALAALMLTGCATSGVSRLPMLPSGYLACFNQMVPRPPPGNLTQRQVFDLIAAFKRSDQAKSQCGRRLIAFYETLARR